MKKIRSWFRWLHTCIILSKLGLIREFAGEYKLSWATWKSLNPNIFKRCDCSKDTLINIIQRCRAGWSRHDICNFARNALYTIDANTMKIMDEKFKARGQPADWYYKSEDQ